MVARANVRWFDMPAAQVEFHNGYETLCWVFDLRHRKEGLGVCHEAITHRKRSASMKDR